MPTMQNERLRLLVADRPGHKNSCDLCGDNTFQTIGEKDRKGNPLKTVVCRNCGLVSHARVPDPEDLTKYYERRYRKEYNSEFTPSPRRVVREWKRGQERFRLLQRYLRASDRVFEVGSGIGCNLAQFKLADHEASGIEPGLQFCQYSRSKLGLSVRHGELADVPTRPKYDLVLLVHVLEHLRSPTGALRHIRKTLKHGGRLYVEVPNLYAPHAAPNKLYHFAHIFNFTPMTLAMFAKVSGFRVERVFSDPRDKNIMMLLSATNTCSLEIQPDSYRKTMEAITRYNSFSYHLRWSYLRDRATFMFHQLVDRLVAEKRLSTIMERLNGHAKPHRAKENDRITITLRNAA